ncbi:unnamed protein product [Ectocarpus sp. CCAP 1310/34]|nr:unnamed protein product [Ectocarpus sp. CCAP 1310/34]
MSYLTLFDRNKLASSPTRCWYRRDTAVVPGRSRTSSLDPPTPRTFLFSFLAKQSKQSKQQRRP